MDNEPDCEAKTRIDAEAQHGIGDVDALLVNFQQPEELRLGLEEIKQHFLDIKADTHHSS
ncbi:MAG TPA: hypothetical protein VIW07_10520 [Candidatus Udaeobacter sp.]|jgi:hypothetical protein